MNELFRLDHPVWNFIGKLVDMLLLTLVWMVTSIPVVTIGASTTAMYYVMLKLAEDKEGNVYSSYFRAFRDNFRQSTAAWLIMLVIGVILSGDFIICYKLQNPMAKVLMIIFAVVAVIWMMISVYLYALIARCENDLKHLFLMAFMMAARHFSWTVLMVVIVVCMFAVAFFVQWLFLLISVGLISYLHAMILKNIFEQYGFGLPDDGYDI